MEKEIYNWLDGLQGEHWWLKARDKIILSQFEKYINNKDTDILEIGFGAGGMLGILSQYGRVCGMDNLDAIHLARKRFPGTNFYEGRLPDSVHFPENSFDRILMLDVLEHIQDDAAALRATLRLLRPGGILFFTVPALKILWSKHDELAMHKRRYKKNEVILKLKEAGYKVIKCSYFNMFLFLPILFAKKISRFNNGPTEKTRFPRFIEAILYKIFSSEEFLLKRMNLPIGVSIICVAQKENG